MFEETEGSVRRRTSEGLRNGSPQLTPETRSSVQLRQAQARQAGAIVLWRRPVTTLCYFSLECLILAKAYGLRLWKAKSFVFLVSLPFLIFTLMYNIQGPHQPFMQLIRKQVIWCSYWVGLGILSSVGLGTGLHTFLLYLGPHIASVTLAAFECNTLEFPEPPYPDEIICPGTKGDTAVTIWQIMSKVRLEAFMWGVGTAIGELPPYFMARAARMSGNVDDEEEELMDIRARRDTGGSLTYMEKAKLYVQNLVEKVGFFGILLCASIPNPLFDLAGITCGHFLVPFWTFFGATLIGKAIIKMHIQKMFVILAFSEKHLENVVDLIKHIPLLGASLHSPFREYLEKQKEKLHYGTGSDEAPATWLAWTFEKLVLLMILYFILSIVNSLAQSYYKRTQTAEPTRVRPRDSLPIARETWANRTTVLN